MPRRQFLVGAGTAAATVAVGAGSAVAQSDEWMSGRGGVNLENDFVQNAYFAEGELTRAKHRAKWGLTREDPVFYENNGNEDELPGFVPTEDTENIVTLRADKIDAPGLSAFPAASSTTRTATANPTPTSMRLTPTTRPSGAATALSIPLRSSRFASRHPATPATPISHSPG